MTRSARALVPPAAGLLAGALATALSGCGSQAQVMPSAIPLLSEVRFGGNGDTLLATECMPVLNGEEEHCRILRVDMNAQTTTAYDGGPGVSIGNPTSSVDGRSIMAVRWRGKSDDQGNLPSEIITISVDDARVKVNYRHPTVLLYPRRAGDGLVFWSQRCSSRADRYCSKEPMFLRGDGKIRPIERSYQFAEVGPIFQRNGRTYVNANNSKAMVFADDMMDYWSKTGGTRFWELSASSRFGLKETTKVVHSIMGQANDTSDLIVVASGEKNLALYRVRGTAVERITPIPETVVPEGASEQRSLDISPDNNRVVFLVGLPPLEEPGHQNEVTIFDIAAGQWQRIALPSATRLQTLQP